MNVVIIGGGAAGCIAALTSAKLGNNVTLIEKNNELGKKMKITGKGRCNITFNGDFDYFQQNICVNSKFMYSSFNNFSNMDTLQFFNNLGVETKLERGNRYFLKNDDASELVNALKKELEKAKVKILYNAQVEKINVKYGECGIRCRGEQCSPRTIFKPKVSERKSENSNISERYYRC